MNDAEADGMDNGQGDHGGSASSSKGARMRLRWDPLPRRAALGLASTTAAHSRTKSATMDDMKSTSTSQSSLMRLFYFVASITAGVTSTYLLGHSLLTCAVVFLCLCGVWHIVSTDLWGRILITILIGAIDVFFREEEVEGVENIPLEGPVLFVCGPHHNQFIDAILIYQKSPRLIAFLMAKKSLRQPVVGPMTQCMKPIAIERPQDIAKRATGRVAVDGCHVTGVETEFLRECKMPCLLLCSRQTMTVERVLSDSVLELRKPPSAPWADPQPFKVAPKLDHSEEFATVYTQLRQGGCVGIFPEGGSHDQSHLLPFKAGAALIALGCTDEGPFPTIIPVGLSYFHGHRFRGRVLVSYGRPIAVDAAMVQAFNRTETRRATTDALLMRVRHGIEAQTTSCTDYDTRRIVWGMRRLCKPDHVQLDMRATAKLSRRLITWYDAHKADPAVKGVVRGLRQYSDLLDVHGIRDHTVPMVSVSRSLIFGRLALGILVLVCYTALLFPVLVLGLPILVATRGVAWYKARQACRSSSVKVQGRDVIATWKVLTACATVPVFWFLYTYLCARLVGQDEAFVFFFLFPGYTLIGIKLADRMRDIFFTLRPLWQSFWQPAIGSVLLRLRRDLQLRIRAVLGPDELAALFGEHAPLSSDEEGDDDAAAEHRRASCPES